MKIIFSRKGFDAGTGGVASPILPDGRLCSLPIPSQVCSCSFKHIVFGDLNLGRIVKSLTNSRLTGEDGAHLDPDLRREALPAQRGWLPSFGPAYRVQRHLAENGVGKGDVFVFFGWFRQVREERGRYGYERGAPDLHVIFGWLQVGAVYRLFRRDSVLPSWAYRHPHFEHGDEWREEDGYEERNALYVAKEKLKLPGLRKNIRGGGVFKRYQDALCLTEPNQKLRGHWRLPRWMYPFPKRRPLTFHSKRAKWCRDEKWAYLDSVDRGQEFVLHAEEYPEAEKWLVSLFNKAF